MDRAAFNRCLGQHLRGKKLTRDQRKMAWCVAAKVCSGKAKDEKEAVQVCLRKHPDWKPLLESKGAKGA